MKTTLATIAIASALLGAALASAAGGPLIDAIGGSVAPEPLTQGGPKRIHIGGHVTGLYPGAERRMRTVVRNDLDRPVRLRKIKVAALSAGDGCAARYLRVRGLRHGRHVIPARHATDVRLAVRMLESAPDACQGARFPLRFKARFGEPGKRGR